jgi:hypothetical protein
MPSTRSRTSPSAIARAMKAARRPNRSRAPKWLSVITPASGGNASRPVVNVTKVIGNLYAPKMGAITAWPGHFTKDNLGVTGQGSATMPFSGNTFSQVVPPEELKALLAPGVGASLPCRDGIDARLVAEMQSGGGRAVDKPAASDWTGCAK